MWLRASLIVAGLTSMACAAAGPSVRPMTSADRSVITAAEIVSSRVTDPHQAVSQLRPEFLRMRGATASPSFRAPPVIVYLDDMEFGYAESLRTIPLGQVRSIRYLSSYEAHMRWGRAHPAGAIQVTTLR